MADPGRTRVTFTAGSARRGAARKRGLNNFERKQVKRLIDNKFETKHLKATYLSQVITSSETITDLSAIAQGDGDTERVGDMVQPIGLRIGFHVQGHASADTELRLLVFRWFRDDGTDAPTGVKVLENYGNVFEAMLSMKNWDDRKDVQVLYDRTIHVENTAGVGGDRSHYVWTKNLKAGKRKIQFDNAGTGGQGKVYLMSVSTQAANGPTVTMLSQLFYKD